MIVLTSDFNPTVEIQFAFVHLKMIILIKYNKLKIQVFNSLVADKKYDFLTSHRLSDFLISIIVFQHREI